MPTVLIALLGVLVFAVAAAVYAVVGDREHRALMGRVVGRDDLLLLRPERAGPATALANWLARHVPTSWAARRDAADMLVHAGYDGPIAPIVYGAIRVASAVGLPLLALAVAPRTNLLRFGLAVGLAVMVGLFGPASMLARMARSRQEKLRRALPDSLDLLVVCVEAGVSLDAAILRVAREMATLHPDLAAELLIVNRRVNAGIPRDQALHGLWQRTGVEELRGLASNMIQSEKWGTSIATVLRVYAETLRRKRKQTAEKKAATAPLKMLFPLGVFIFPTIFIVIVGPAFIKITAMFKGLNQ